MTFQIKLLLITFLIGISSISHAQKALHLSNSSSSRSILDGTKIRLDDDTQSPLELGRKILPVKLIDSSHLFKSGGSDPGGGNEIAVEILNSFNLAIDRLKSVYPVELNEELYARLHQAALGMKVIVVNEDLSVTVNGQIQESTMVNYPEMALVKVNEKRWKGISSSLMKEAISLHEVASLARYEKSGVYPLTYLHLSSAVSTKNAISKLQFEDARSPFLKDFKNEIDPAIADVVFENANAINDMIDEKIKIGIGADGAVLFNLGYALFCQKDNQSEFIVKAKGFIEYNPFGKVKSSIEPLSDILDVSGCSKATLTFQGQVHSQSKWLTADVNNILKVNVFLKSADRKSDRIFQFTEAVLVNSDKRKQNAGSIRGRIILK